MNKTNTIITLAVLIVLAFGVYLLLNDSSDTVDLSDDDTEMATDTPATSTDETATTSDDEADNPEDGGVSVIGTSVDGRDIEAYHFGDGETKLLFVGGIHGAYGWNTALLSYELIDYLEDNPDEIPENISVTVVPVLNPDGLYSIAGTAGADFSAADMPAVSETVSGRFNANGVDLNRNFDCNWQSEGTWQSQTVDGGDEVFSEPESQALRDYINANPPHAAVAFYSAAGAVYSSNCDGDAMVETNEIMDAYAEAANYSAEGEFTAYEISGDMTNWLAKEGIPTISVLLSNHEDIEWNKNQAGIEAIFNYYSE